MRSLNSSKAFGVVVCACCLLFAMAPTVRANDCCEFAPPSGCASAPVGQIDTLTCLHEGGIPVNNKTCSLVSGNCETKVAPGGPVCAGLSPSVCCAVNPTVPTCPVPVPAIPGLGLVALIVLILGAGTAVIWRRGLVV